MLRTPDEITRQIQALDEVMEITRLAIEKNPLHPDAIVMRDMLQEDIRSKDELIRELEKSLSYYRQHTLKLSFLTDATSLPVHAMNDILSAFSTFVKTAHTIINHKEKNIPLYFRSTYYGSFGLLLTTDPSNALFDDVDEQMGVVFDALNTAISDSGDAEALKTDIQKILKKDKKSLNRLRLLFEKMTKNKYGINFEWLSTDNRSHRANIPLEKSIKVYEMLSTAIDSKEEEIEIAGTVKALDLTDNTFKIKVSKEIYTIKVGSDQTQQIKSLIDEEIRCKVLEEKRFNTITEKEDLNYTLIEIYS